MAKIESFRDLLVCKSRLTLLFAAIVWPDVFPAMNNPRSAIKRASRRYRCHRTSLRGSRDTRRRRTSNTCGLRTRPVLNYRQLIVGNRIEIVSEAEAATLIADAEEVGRMIHGLVTSLERAR
jgi:hypothetical protein